MSGNALIGFGAGSESGGMFLTSSGSGSPSRGASSPRGTPSRVTVTRAAAPATS